MDKITCPHDWFCGRDFSLDEKQRTFVRSSKEKGMKIIFIECPHCSQSAIIELNTEKVRSTLPNPNNTVSKSTKLSKKETLSILEKNKIHLPIALHKYLYLEKGKLKIFEDEDDFKLYSLHELSDNIAVNHKETLRVLQLNVFASSLKETYQDQENTFDQKGFPFPLSRLSKCLAIGEENERVLFIDPDDSNSVWIFHIDDGGVEKVNSTLEQLIQRED